jgi:hypothetical protein
MSDVAADAPERNTFSALGEALESAAQYVSGAGATAGASVKAAAGKSGAAVSVGSYKAAYGLSYGVVFAGVFLKELLPNGSSVRRGFEDGADAAFDAIEARKAPVEPEEALEPAPAKARRIRKTAPAAE